MKRRDFLRQSATTTAALGAGSAALYGPGPAGVPVEHGSAASGRPAADGGLVRTFEDRNPDGSYRYGPRFNDEGEIVNGTDVFEAILADTPEGGTIRWQTTWLHTRPVQISKRVDLDGAISAPILVNMPDPRKDVALLVKGAGSTRGGITTYHGPAYFTHRFVMLGGSAANGHRSPVCLHGAQYFFCARARVIAHIRLPCTGWGLVSAGNLYGEFDLTMSTNHPYFNHRGRQISTGMPYRGLWACPAAFQVNARGGEPAGWSGNNNTHFHLNFAAANVLIEDGVGQSNLRLSGSVEGGLARESGEPRTLVLKGLTTPRIHDLHYESNAGPLTVVDCTAPRLEHVLMAGGPTQGRGMVLDLDGTINATLDNVQVDELLIRPACVRTCVGALTYGVNHPPSGVKDYSPSTVFLAAPNRAAQQWSGATGAGEGTGINLIPNGHFAQELAYTPAGGALTAARTADRDARFRFPWGYRLTSTARGDERRMIHVPIPGVDQQGNAMDFTFWAWVRWVRPPRAGGAPTFLVGGIDSGSGATLTGGLLFPDAPGWVRIATRGTVSGVPTFVIGGYGPFDVYVGEIGATYGQTAPAGWVPS